MLGAIIGDIVGSPYEFDNHRSTEFRLFTRRSFFTDDTVLTIATAVKLLYGGTYAERYHEYYRLYPDCSYGARFHQWGMSGGLEPYYSFGNGSAMRVSPVGFAFPTLEETLSEARLSAVATHNHPEGIKGAQATAAAVFLARTGHSKEEIAEYVWSLFMYDVKLDLSELRQTYGFNETCQRTVPQALAVFLQSNSFEDAIRKAVSIGGDSDTIACIVGGIAEAFYKRIPETIRKGALTRLDDRLKGIIEAFYGKYGQA